MNVQDNILIIRLNNKKGEPNIDSLSKENLYERTRAAWDYSFRYLERATYALAAYHGYVIEVYKIDSWDYVRNLNRPEPLHSIDIMGEKRKAFYGKVAPEDVRQRYVGQSIKEFFKRGDQNPVKFIGIDWK